jgi:nitroimidazol reductase NimA-like FMN-containing flavoprotein (pyridoxamine 5'-phosphate oxidase superfamily)
LIHELTLAECRDVLSRASLARLACARADQPYVVPVSFAYDTESNSLFSFSTIGRKVEWMRENPKVCLEIEDISDKFHWTTVVIVGRYDEIADSNEHTAIRRRALDLFKTRDEWWLPGAARLGPTEHHAMVMYRVLIDRMTGRRAARDRGTS